MLTTPQCLVHLVVQSQFLNIMVGPQLLNIMVRPELLTIMVGPQLLDIMVRTQLQLSASMAENPSVCLHGPKSTPNRCVFQNLQILWTISLLKCFSKSSDSQDHCLRAWHHSHSSLISYLGFIMTIVIVISFAHECKLYPMLCSWTKRRIVQNPTKLNDKM